MQGAITDLFAGVPVSDLDASIEWYTRFFGRPPDRRVGDEVLWEIDEHATLFVEPKAARAGAGRITFAVVGLDALLERLAAEGIEHEPIETYSNGVRHVDVPDPDERDRVGRAARGLAAVLAHENDMGCIDRDGLAAGRAGQPGQRAGAAARGVLELLDDLVERSVHVQLLAGGEHDHRHSRPCFCGSWGAAAANSVTEYTGFRTRTCSERPPVERQWSM
jgi:catechol 2,3-dioxygenase-like lactoylglutathione lyase family enzyme